MKVYLASWFHSKELMAERAKELRANNIAVTSRWIDESVSGLAESLSEDYLRDTAAVDVEDVLRANVLVLNVPSDEDLSNNNVPITGWARGGRHFEAGLQYATMVLFSHLPDNIKAHGTRRLVLVGRRENIFHHLDGVVAMQADSLYLPEILAFDTWAETLRFLIDTSRKEKASEESTSGVCVR